MKKYYISATGLKKLNITSSVGRGGTDGGFWGVMKGKAMLAANHRNFRRAMILPIVLMLAILLPFLFLRVAYIVIESASGCSSSVGNFCTTLFILFSET